MDIIKERFNFSKIEKKWQKKWADNKIFESNEDLNKNKLYVLEMFPYPSGNGLHMGHAFNYTIGDIYARFKRMKRFNILYPMGYDSFGLPAENAAIKENTHPKKYTLKSIKNFVKQQKSLGLSYDWNRMIITSEPEYYKWNQYFFLKFMEQGLVYRKKASVNWCSECNTVLANEQVHQGKCWRHNNIDVKIKQLEQWFLKITNYAEELLESIENLDWPERIKAMQRNWIGKSTGAEIVFVINWREWKIFTTRPDTLYGVTFLVISAQHPDLMSIVTDKQKAEVEKFIIKVKSTKEGEINQLEKEGVFTGSYTTHPLTNEKIPVYVGNFVLADYGNGIVMAVPAHDQRDFEFATKYNLPIKRVIRKEGQIIDTEPMKEAYTGEGILVSSDRFEGMQSKEARNKIVTYLTEKKLGNESIQYKLRDWLISRQRYWGTPIPIIYCDNCSIVPVPEKDLPVILPEKVKFGEGNPLITNEQFVNTKCPKCGRNARRETDTMDTFFDSSWYFLKYTDPKNTKEPFNVKKAEYWMPVDMYIGGAEHACMHLIYARFFTKVLRDLGFVKLNEPFPKLFNQGMLHKDKAVMSKSKGNVVLPEEISKKHGIDTARLFLVSIANPDKDIEWSDQGIEGSSRFMKQIIQYSNNVKFGRSSKRVTSKLHSTIQEVEQLIENLKYNLAVIRLRTLFESLEEEIEKEDWFAFILMLSPFCPHISEELWEKSGGKEFASLTEWPKYDINKIDKKLEAAEKAIDHTINDVLNVIYIVKEKKGKEVKKIYLYVLPNEVEYYDANLLEKRVGKEIQVFAVNNKNKYDPENKSAKAKPWKPGIYVE